MKPPSFDYRVAAGIDEAVALLAAGAGAAKALAGGQSLVPMMNFRIVAPTLLVDLNRIASLAFIEERPDGIAIGALTRHGAIETSALIAARFPVLRAAMAHVAHLAIRNRGTIGGSLAHADPAAELPMLALLLDARIRTAAAEGGRTIAARNFFRGALTTALADDEIIVAVELPALSRGAGWGFEEFARRAGDFAIAAAAATIVVRGGRCVEARLALTGIGETPLRVAAAEALLLGHDGAPEVIAAVADAARDATDPPSDLHGSADYRRHLVAVLTRRAVAAAWARARGEAA